MNDTTSLTTSTAAVLSDQPGWTNPILRGPFVDRTGLYRLPWSRSDNPIGWLEMTDSCDLACRGCYRRRKSGHKELEQIKEEIDLFERVRNTDSIVLAGGEPTLHPQFFETVSYIDEKGMKPHITTGGQRLLDRDFVREMRRAGVEGMGVHVDSMQGRPGWNGRTESELNELRERMARTVREVGGMNCGFGITVFRENLGDIPALARWTVENRHMVSSFSFITYRGLPFVEGVTYGVHGRPVEVSREDIGYATIEDLKAVSITAFDVLEQIRKGVPEWSPACYLGGTMEHRSVKWLIGVLLATKGKVLGSIGPRTIECGQVLGHLLHGKYVVYSRGRYLSRGALLTGLFDRRTRKVWRHYFRNPLRIFRRLYGVSFGIVQAPDLLSVGTIDMCDSCPDMTVWKGKLVNSCRMDEYRSYGGLLSPLFTEERAGRNPPSGNGAEDG